MFLGTTSTYSSRSVDSRAFFSKFMMVGYPYLVPDLEGNHKNPHIFDGIWGKSGVFLMDFQHITQKIFDFYLRQNVSKSIITFPKWHKYIENIAKKTGVASGASLPKRATALVGGRDPLRFSGISLKSLRFWEFPNFIFLRKLSRGYKKFKSQQKKLGNERFRTRYNFSKKFQ